jgi:hypothetical protein
MPRYAITEKAGRFVAGTNNTGVGTVLNLTEKQAEHEVRLGALRPLDGPQPEPVEQKAEGQTGVEPEKATKQAAPKGAKK